MKDLRASLNIRIGRVRALRSRWREELWNTELPPIASFKGVSYRLGRLANIVSHGFREDQLRLHAASLTYSTLMSLLPILAIALAIAKGLGQDQKANDFLLDYTADMPAEFQTFVENLLAIVTQTDFAKLGAIGALFLLYMVIQVLTQIEHSFNSLWSIRIQRALARRVTNYITLVVVLPVLLLAGFTAIASFNQGESVLQHLGLFRILPFVATWLAFSFLYGSMPNTRVRVLPALIGGFAGALMWQGWLEFYAYAQPGVTRYNVLYGALASIPIFLIWLYVSWILVLIGAKTTYAVQNGAAYHPDFTKGAANLETRFTLGLTILRKAALSLERGAPPFTRTEGLSMTRDPFLLEEVLALLKRSRLLAQTEEDVYLLQRSPSYITLLQIFRCFVEDGQDADSLGISGLNADMASMIERFFEGLNGETSLADLMEQSELPRPVSRETA